MNEDRYMNLTEKKVHELLETPKLSSVYDITPLLNELSELVFRDGLNNEHITQLLAMVLDTNNTKITTSQKLFVVKKLLISNQNASLSLELIPQIISNIGVPQLYYRGSKRLKTRRLSQNIQISVLDWLISSIHLFGSEVYSKLHGLLPILFTCLSYEYSRPQISNLIFLSISNDLSPVKTYMGEERTHMRNTFKPWHVELVLDLFLKFPSDEYLKALLILFKTVNPKLDLKTFSSQQVNIDLLGPINPKIFGYPKFDYLDRLNDVKLLSSNSNSSEMLLKENSRKYRNFELILQARKKMKSGASGNLEDLDVIEFVTKDNDTSIHDVHSTKKLVDSLADIRFININNLFRPDSEVEYESDKFKKLYLVMKGLTDDTSFLKKIDFFIRYTLLDENLSDNEYNILVTKIDDFLDMSRGNLSLKSIEDFVFSKFDIKPVTGDNIALINMTRRNKLIKYCIPEDFDFFKENYLEQATKVIVNGDMNVKVSTVEVAICDFLDALTKAFTSWLSSTAADKTDYESIHDIIRQSISYVYDFMIQHYLDSSLKVKMAIIKVFDFIESLPPDSLNMLDSESVIPKPELIYNLLFSNSSFIFSKVCGYLNFCKCYHGLETSSYHKRLLNSYIMDIVNFVWRDKAFEFDYSVDGKSKAMCLSPHFVEKLKSSSFSNYSGLLSFKNIGNLFHHPYWSYLSAHIIWSLEDRESDITTRHLGPVTEDSVNILNGDKEQKWLDKDYKQLKVDVLNELDKIGYKGVCDLLFTSLAPLLEQRQKEK